MKTLALTILILSFTAAVSAADPMDTLQSWQREGSQRQFYMGAVVGAVRVLQIFATCSQPVSGGMVIAVLNANAPDPTWSQLEFSTAVMAAMYRLGCTFDPPQATAKAQRAY
jgi:hypothetical protein